MRLGDVATYHRGLTYSKRDEADDGSLRVLRANNVSLERKVIDWEDVKQINPSKAIRESVLLKSNDILMVANSGSKDHVGKIAYVTQDYEDVAFGGFMAAIRTKEGYPSRYIYHHLQSQAFRDYKDGLLATATINNLKGQLVEDFLIPLPPREVQDKVVEYLDTFAALCENLDTEIAQREQQFAAYREKLLSTEYLMTHYFPNGAKYAKLGEIGEVRRGRGLTKRDLQDEGVPVIHYGQIYTRYGIATSETISRVSSTITSKLTSVLPNSLIVASTSENLEDLGKCTVWRGKETIYTGLHTLVYSSQANTSFVANVLSTRRFYMYKSQNCYGAKVIELTAKAFADFCIPLPPRKVQDEIVTKLDAMQELIDNLRLEREQRQQQFDYYRERLLSFSKKNTAEV